MKPYGHERRDGQTCTYGCCGLTKSNVSNKLPSARRAVDMAAKRRARQADKKESAVPTEDDDAS